MAILFVDWNLDHICLPNKKKVFSVYLDVRIIIGKGEEAFRDVGLLTMHIAPPCAHYHPQLLCVRMGQKRTCKGGVVMFPMDSKELTVSCYLLDCVYGSYVLLT